MLLTCTTCAARGDGGSTTTSRSGSDGTTELMAQQAADVEEGEGKDDGETGAGSSGSGSGSGNKAAVEAGSTSRVASSGDDDGSASSGAQRRNVVVEINPDGTITTNPRP